MNDSLFALLAILIISGIIVISVAINRRKPSKGNIQYNLLHDAAALNTSRPKKNSNLDTTPSTFSFPFSQTELALVSLCLKYSRRIIKNTEQQNFSTLSDKLSVKFNSDPEFPYDSLIDLDSEEAQLVDNALHLMMTDSVMAQRYGSVADTYIDGKGISELAKHVILMRDLLRRLDISKQMHLFQTQLYILKQGQEK